MSRSSFGFSLRSAPAQDLAHPGSGRDFVDGIPDENLQATSTYEMTPEQRVEWEAEVRSLYHDAMVRIVVTPNWAKLIDFESTLPSAVEELVRHREERQRPEHRVVGRMGWIVHASTHCGAWSL